MPKRGLNLFLNERNNEYLNFLEKIQPNIQKLQENNFLNKADIENLLKDYQLENSVDNILYFQEDEKELVRESIEKATLEQDFSIEVSLLFIKRAKLLSIDQGEFENIFNYFSKGEESIGRENFINTFPKVSALKNMDEKILQKMIDMAGGFPITKISLKKLFIITGWIDDKIKVLDSVVNKSLKKKKPKIN